MAATSPLSVPDHLEEPFLADGPRALHHLVERIGGRERASRAGRVATSTLSRWLSSKPGKIFGPYQVMRPWRSVWVGYPSPFPGLDRMVEEVYGPKASFIQLLAANGDVSSARPVPFDDYVSLCKRLSSGLFGLACLGMSDVEADGAAIRLGVPAATARRWWNGARYPHQWAVLDRLSFSVHGCPWIEVVLRHDVSSVTAAKRKVPVGALSVLTSVFEQRVRP